MRPDLVLLVDDDHDSRHVCRTILHFHGFEVLEAADGLEALRMASAHLPGVILLDIALPSMDGWTVVDRLRAVPGTAAIPVIVVSAHASAEHLDFGRRAGVHSYLTKPCAPSRVLEAVRQALPALPEPDAG